MAEGLCSDGFDIFTLKGDFFQAFVVVQYPFSKDTHPCPEGDGGKGAAVFKRTAADLGDIISYGYFF